MNDPNNKHVLDVEFADSDEADEYIVEISEILGAIGIKPIFVSNESELWDFFSTEGENREEEEAEFMAKIERETGLGGLQLTDKLVDLAKRLRKRHTH